MSLSAEQLQEAIDNCDSDPIHIPGSIQDFGLLIGADLKFEQISCCLLYTSDAADE